MPEYVSENKKRRRTNKYVIRAYTSNIEKNHGDACLQLAPRIAVSAFLYCLCLFHASRLGILCRYLFLEF